MIYEVNIDLDAQLRVEYLHWLEHHVAEICTLPGFTGAQVWEVVDPAPAADRVRLCMQYRVRDAASLDAYLREHAPRLRADGVARFGARFTATRRVLRPLDDVDAGVSAVDGGA